MIEINPDEREFLRRSEVYAHECMSEYTEHLEANLSLEPKTMLQLMEGWCGCWETRPAALEIERLILVGKAKFHHQDGPFFQHKYFTCADGIKPQRPEFKIFTITMRSFKNLKRSLLRQIWRLVK